MGRTSHHSHTFLQAEVRPSQQTDSRKMTPTPPFPASLSVPLLTKISVLVRPISKLEYHAIKWLLLSVDISIRRDLLTDFPVLQKNVYSPGCGIGDFPTSPESWGSCPLAIGLVFLSANISSVAFERLTDATRADQGRDGISDLGIHTFDRVTISLEVF
jgi:hypothetical protein